MSQGPSRGVIAAIVLGGFTFLSFSLWLYYKWFKPSPPAIKDAPAATNDANKKKESSSTTTSTSATSTAKKAVVTVEDESDSEDEESDSEDEAEEATTTSSSQTTTNNNNTADSAAEAAAKAAKAEADAKAAELKQQYDALVRTATKLIQGNAYERAIEKLNEAIELAQVVPSAAKDINTLYNNRSAMYEKTSQYDACLRDITVVLTMDHTHLKARLRRARVYEAQQKVWEALQDYVYAMIVERMKQEPPSNERKIMQICKLVGAERTQATLKEMRTKTKESRDFPSKSFIRTILESYPNYFIWKDQYANNEMKSGLQSAVLDSKVSIGKGEAFNTANLLYIQHSLALIHYELVHEQYPDAFALLHALIDDVDNDDMLSTLSLDSNAGLALSQYHELRGLEVQLRSFAHAEEALQIYRQGKQAYAANVNVGLKVASTLLDLGRLDEAKQEFDALLALWTERDNSNTNSADEAVLVDAPGTSADGESDDAGFADARASPAPSSPLGDAFDAVTIRANRAWILIHRASYFIARDSLGNYMPNAVENALQDLDEAARLTEAAVLPEAKGALFTALLKSVHVRTQTKAATEQQPTDEDFSRNRECIDGAKKIFPDHDTILLMEADQMSNEGRSEEALSLLDRKKNKDSDVTVMLIRASVLTTKAFADMSNPSAMMLVQAQLGEVAQLYARALEIDPMAVEIMAQFAQLKSMILGDLQGAVDLLKRALPLARSRDEVQELCQLLAMNEAQLIAINNLQNGM